MFEGFSVEFLLLLFTSVRNVEKCKISEMCFLTELCSHHRLTAEDVWVVFIDEFLHSLLPHPEHLGASVLCQGKLLQHDVFGSPDLCSQVKLRCFWL